MRLEVTPRDRAEAARLHRRLEWLPRFSMTTTGGRLALNALLWLAEMYPLLRRDRLDLRPEIREVELPTGRTRLRVFRPDGPIAGVVVHFHGGGWTIGNARMADAESAALAVRLRVTLVSVDYHLAVSRSLDAVIEECTNAAGWVLHNAASAFGADRAIVAGSSAGAHLAAASLIGLRERSPDFDKVAAALLMYGLYDFAGTAMVRAAGPAFVLLHGPTVRATLAKLTPGMSDDQRRAGALSPLYADLAGLPPALFMVGERDMLLEDNQRMAAAWQAASGNAELMVVPASPHAFDRFDTAVARKARAASDEWLRDRLRQPASSTD